MIYLIDKSWKGGAEYIARVVSYSVDKETKHIDINGWQALYGLEPSGNGEVLYRTARSVKSDYDWITLTFEVDNFWENR